MVNIFALTIFFFSLKLNKLNFIFTLGHLDSRGQKKDSKKSKHQQEYVLNNIYLFFKCKKYKVEIKNYDLMQITENSLWCVNILGLWCWYCLTLLSHLKNWLLWRSLSNLMGGEPSSLHHTLSNGLECGRPAHSLLMSTTWSQHSVFCFWVFWNIPSKFWLFEVFKGLRWRWIHWKSLQSVCCGETWEKVTIELSPQQTRGSKR